LVFVAVVFFAAIVPRLRHFSSLKKRTLAGLSRDSANTERGTIY
jgi:hypothetical protein